MATDSIFIFLSGSVQKGKPDDRDAESFWSITDENYIIDTLAPLTVNILNPNSLDLERLEYKIRFISDIELMLKSDIILVDAKTKKGIGVGAEMMLAKNASIPVFTICPTDSHYRKFYAHNNQRQEWMHPFVFGLSDKVFQSLDGAVNRIHEVVKNGELTLNNGKPRAMSKAFINLLNI